MIRLATIEDLDSIYNVEINSFDDPWDKETIYYFLAVNPFVKTFVYVENEQIIAYMMAEIVDNTTIDSIGVMKEYQTKGIGTKLFEELFKHSEGNMTLEVRVSNSKAIALYKKFGFEIHRVLEHFYEDGEDAYSMIRLQEGK